MDLGSPGKCCHKEADTSEGHRCGKSAWICGKTMGINARFEIGKYQQEFRMPRVYKYSCSDSPYRLSCLSVPRWIRRFSRKQSIISLGALINGSNRQGCVLNWKGRSWSRSVAGMQVSSSLAASHFRPGHIPFPDIFCWNFNQRNFCVILLWCQSCQGVILWLHYILQLSYGFRTCLKA